MNHPGFELKGKHSPGEGADAEVHRVLPVFSLCHHTLGNVPERLASAQLLSIAHLTSGFTTELRFSLVAERTEGFQGSWPTPAEAQPAPCKGFSLAPPLT